MARRFIIRNEICIVYTESAARASANLSPSRRRTSHAAGARHCKLHFAQCTLAPSPSPPLFCCRRSRILSRSYNFATDPCRDACLLHVRILIRIARRIIHSFLSLLVLFVISSKAVIIVFNVLDCDIGNFVPDIIKELF